MTYRQRVQQIERSLGRRRLVYFGTRGSDARSLLAFPQFEQVFSQVAPLNALGICETSLETLTGQRVDLNRYSIDLDPSAAVAQLRTAMLRAFAEPAAVVPYRPSAVLTSAWFPRSDRVLYLGLFHEKQAYFEHKPWVETQLGALGVRTLPWRYYSDEDLPLIYEEARAGEIVLRSNRSDGGAGLTLVRKLEQLTNEWPSHRDGFLAAAPFLSGALSLNVNATVWPSGEASLYAPSIQLVGLALSTSRSLGYCGNDFALPRDLELRVLDELELLSRTVGRWLAREGYVGAFGLDALLHQGRLYLTEINPRFQGSTSLAAMIAQELDLPDPFLDHMAAFLGLPPAPPVPLRDLARAHRPAAHVLCYNRFPHPVRAQPAQLRDHSVAIGLQADLGVAVHPEAILFDATFSSAVTTDGMSLRPEVHATIQRILRELSSGEPSPMFATGQDTYTQSSHLEPTQPSLAAGPAQAYRGGGPAAQDPPSKQIPDSSNQPHRDGLPRETS